MFFLLQMDRQEIFTVLCNSQNIDEAELDLKQLVQLSNGFTGADINAAITLARLSAFENALVATPVSAFLYMYIEINYIYCIFISAYGRMQQHLYKSLIVINNLNSIIRDP